MRTLTTPIIKKNFIPGIGKTAIEFVLDGQTQACFAPGNHEDKPDLLVNVVINEVGDKFTAGKDSAQMGADGKTPIYKKGDVVTRQKQSIDFKSLTGSGQATAFAQGAQAFGLQLVVQM